VDINEIWFQLGVNSAIVIAIAELTEVLVPYVVTGQIDAELMSRITFEFGRKLTDRQIEMPKIPKPS